MVASGVTTTGVSMAAVATIVVNTSKSNEVRHTCGFRNFRNTVTPQNSLTQSLT